MNKVHPAYKVAVVQSSPAFLDLEATIDKCCALIAEAAARGAKLIAFPESFVPGFPIWIFETGPFGKAGDLFLKLYNNSVEVPGEAVRRISEAARNGEIYVCLGASEREMGTLYLSQLWFDDKGNLIGKHRKLKPTGPERFVWGEGDGSTMGVFNTPLGNLGGLICWEHRIPLAAAVMAAQNEQVHVGAWNVIAPFVRGGLSSPDTSDTQKTQSDPALPTESSSFEVTNRYYALSTQTYVLAATMVLLPEHIELFSDCDPEMMARFKAGCGSSRIISPEGITIGDILPPHEEGIIYADIDLERIVSAKYMCDTGGHYSSPHVISANLNRQSAPVCNFTGEFSPGNVLSYDALQKS